MIIDSHVHIGKVGRMNMPEEMVLASMEKYGIDFSIVSNIEGCEVGDNEIPIPDRFQSGQTELNEKTLRFVRANPDKLGATLWIKPLMEGVTDEFEELIVKNRDIIYGLKVHPYHSNLLFNSPQIAEYIKLARKYSLVMVTHTADDYCSRPEAVYDAALKNPDVNIVMYHLGLGTDNEDAIEMVSSLPNLYCDTAWVEPEKTIKAIEVCGIDKVLFGTDNPIDGLDTYNNDMFYNYYFNEMKYDLSQEDYAKFMYKNAINLFKIKLFENKL